MNDKIPLLYLILDDGSPLINKIKTTNTQTVVGISGLVVLLVFEQDKDLLAYDGTPQNFHGDMILEFKDKYGIEGLGLIKGDQMSVITLDEALADYEEFKKTRNPQEDGR